MPCFSAHASKMRSRARSSGVPRGEVRGTSAEATEARVATPEEATAALEMRRRASAVAARAPSAPRMTTRRGMAEICCGGGGGDMKTDGRRNGSADQRGRRFGRDDVGVGARGVGFVSRWSREILSWNPRGWRSSDAGSVVSGKR